MSSKVWPSGINMEEVKGYDTETEKEGAGSSEVTIYDGKSNGAVAAADHKPVIVHWFVFFLHFSILLNKWS